MKISGLRKAAIYGIANGLSAGVSFLLLPVLTRSLTPAAYGMVINFFMLVTLSTSVAGLSAHGAVSVKWFERHTVDFPRFVGSAVLLCLASTAFCGAVLVVASFVPFTGMTMPPVLWFLAAVLAGANVILGIRTALWQSQGLALQSATLQVSAAFLNIALSLAAVLLLSMEGEGRILGAVVATIVSAAAAIWFLQRSGDAAWAPSRSNFSALLRFGLPLIPHSLAGAWLATADRFSVSAVLGSDALGLYGTAAQIGTAMGILGDAVAKVFSPWVYKQMASRTLRARLRIVGATYLLIPVWVLMAIGIWLLLKASGSALLGVRYLPAIDLSLWFLLGGATTAIYLNIAGLFFFTSKTEWLSTATVTTAVTAAFAAPAMTLKWGIPGAAASFVLAQVFFLGLVWAFSTRVHPMPWNYPRLAIRSLMGRSAA